MKSILSAAFFVLTLLLTSAAVAQTYPDRPIKIVVGYPPGGGADTVARLVGRHLATAFGKPVLVENRAGADGILAGAAVATAAPDGYTLLLVSSSHAINVALNKKMSFDTVRDFAPVAHIVDQQLVFVSHPSRPYHTVPDLVKFMKANPGMVNFGSSSTGSALPMELFRLETGTKFVHVPYKGTSPVLADLLAGHIDVTMAGAASAVQHVKAGRMRALAVGSAKRSEIFPDIPAMNEFLPGFQVSFWSAIFAPAKTPPAIIRQLNAEIARITRLPEFVKAMQDLGADVVGGTPEELEQFTLREIEKWTRVVKETGFSEGGT